MEVRGARRGFPEIKADRGTSSQPAAGVTIHLATTSSTPPSLPPKSINQAPLHYSNVMILDPITNKPVRTRWVFDAEAGQKLRLTRGKGASRSVIYPPAPHKTHPGPDTRGGWGRIAGAVWRWSPQQLVPLRGV
jgi:hypothetical protein